MCLLRLVGLAFKCSYLYIYQGHHSISWSRETDTMYSIMLKHLHPHTSYQYTYSSPVVFVLSCLPMENG